MIPLRQINIGEDTCLKVLSFDNAARHPLSVNKQRVFLVSAVCTGQNDRDVIHAALVDMHRQFHAITCFLEAFHPGPVA